MPPGLSAVCRSSSTPEGSVVMPMQSQGYVAAPEGACILTWVG